MSNKQLKPCDDCKEDSFLHLTTGDNRWNLDKWYAICLKCGNSTKWFNTEAEAIAAWNTRPIEDELRARIKELEEQLEDQRLEAKNERD